MLISGGSRDTKDERCTLINEDSYHPLEDSIEQILRLGVSNGRSMGGHDGLFALMCLGWRLVYQGGRRLE